MSAERVFDGEEDAPEGDPAHEEETRAAAERIYTTLLIPVHVVLDDPKRTRKLGLTNTQKIRFRVVDAFYDRVCTAAPVLDESELPGISTQVREKTSSLADQYEAAIKMVGESLAKLVKERSLNIADVKAIEQLVHDAGFYDLVHQRLSSKGGLSGVESLVAEEIPGMVERYLTATKMVGDALRSSVEKYNFSEMDLTRKGTGIEYRVADSDLYNRTYRNLVRELPHVQSWLVAKIGNIVNGYLNWREAKRASESKENVTDTVKLHVRGGSAYSSAGTPVQKATDHTRRVIPAIPVQE